MRRKAHGSKALVILRLKCAHHMPSRASPRVTAVIEVKVRAANGAGRDLAYGIPRIFDHGIGNGFKPNVTRTVPTEAL